MRGNAEGNRERTGKAVEGGTDVGVQWRAPQVCRVHRGFTSVPAPDSYCSACALSMMEACEDKGLCT